MAAVTGRRILQTLVVLAVLVLAVEIGLRYATGLGDPPLFQKDPQIGYLMAANQEVRRLGNRIAINRFHQRSEDLAEQPAAGLVRLFFLGDSITFGVSSVDQTETFPELAAAELRAAQLPVEVMNASAVSWGIGNELAYVERFGTFGSQIAVLQVGSSDLLQPTSVGDRVGIDPSQPDRKPATAIGELFERYLVPRLMDYLGAPQPLREPVAEDAREAQFQRNMKDFLALVAKVEGAGTAPIILLMPGLPEVMPQDGELFGRYAPYRDRFKTLVETLGLPLVDLSTEWQGDPNAPDYYTDGTHLTLAGNQVLSKRIVWTIKEVLARQSQAASPLASAPD